MLLNGTPPKGASCVNDDGYWKRAAAEVYGVKNPTLRLAKVLYSHFLRRWRWNRINFLQLHVVIQPCCIAYADNQTTVQGNKKNLYKSYGNEC
jgi:hypothetical protein